MNESRQYGRSVVLSVLVLSVLLSAFLWMGRIVNAEFNGGHADNIPRLFTLLYLTLFLPAAFLTQLTNLPVGLFLFWVPVAALFGWLRVKCPWWKAAAIIVTVVILTGITMNMAMMALSD
jgi:hypothetical protein